MSTLLPTGRRSYRSRRTTSIAWQIAQPVERREHTQLLDLVAFASFAFGLVDIPGIGLPLNEVLPMALCAVALTRPNTSHRRTPWWFIAMLVSLLGYLALTSYLHDATPVRRLAHVTTYITLAMFLASGRIHVRSAVQGIAVGMSISIPLAVAHVGPDGYAGRLTGYLGDPNGAGYFVTTLGVLAIGLVTHRQLRLAMMLLVPLAVVLTLSRTTLLAAAFTLVWLAVGQRVSRVVGLLLVGAMVYVVGHIPPQLKSFGPFADRSGSDALRQRIIALERIQIHESPIFGSGAGSAHVDVGQDTFFYHSSYLALQREGGLVAVFLFIVLVAMVFFRATGQPKAERNGWVEASLICVMVCAVNLGEVLLELPASVALGIVMWQALSSSPAPAVAATLVDPTSLRARRRPPGPLPRHLSGDVS